MYNILKWCDYFPLSNNRYEYITMGIEMYSLFIYIYYISAKNNYLCSKTRKYIITIKNNSKINI